MDSIICVAVMTARLRARTRLMMSFCSLAPEAAVPLVYEDEWEHQDHKLDEALDETFPASDPVELAPE